MIDYLFGTFAGIATVIVVAGLVLAWCVVGWQTWQDRNR